jgi:hypothetical protein
MDKKSIKQAKNSDFNKLVCSKFINDRPTSFYTSTLARHRNNKEKPPIKSGAKF